MQYRREIDGLRAVAVLPVILFHAGFSAFSGGFIGVDVFFVISGYLITTIILTEKEKGSFSLVMFYERRARRILPALFFVMLCCLPFAWFWLPPNDFKDFSQSIAAVSVFSSNILFWFESGYFDTASELKPLLHTWSLAVEEQYYVLFPLLLMFMWRIGKRWIFKSLVAITVASLALAQWGAYNKPAATFFLLPTRGWELAIGALIAFYFLYKKEHAAFMRSNHAISEMFGLIGITFIFYSIYAFDRSTPFPSFHAIIPTIGTALIIVFTTPKTIVGRFLGTKVMVGVGLISYSTYLWHQPLFVFARHKFSPELSVGFLLALSVLSVALAYISWRFVEVPFRNKEVFNRKKIFVFSLISSLVFVCVGLSGHLKEGFPDRFGFSNKLIASFKHSTPICPDSGELDAFTCVLGEIEKAPKFFVMGDSHAASLYNAFNSAANSTEISGRFASLVGCLPLLGDVHPLKLDSDSQQCNDMNKKVREFVIQNNIKNLFLVARWNSYSEMGDKKINIFAEPWRLEEAMPSIEFSRSVFVDLFNRTMDEYQKLGVKVFLLKQYPRQDYMPESIYMSAYSNYKNEERIAVLSNYSLKYDKHKNSSKFVNNVFSGKNYPIIVDLDKIYCDDEICSVGTPGVSYYSDGDHLSISGASLLKPEIEGLLKEISSAEE